MTIKEIAGLAGVSISTVSKIVNNKDDHINEETRNRVLKIVKEYHYTPYGKVKSLSAAKTFRLGVLFSGLSRSLSLLDGILAAADEHGYAVTVYDSRQSREEELKHITALCEQKPDGVLWQPLNEDSREHSRHFQEAGIPFQLLQTTGDNADDAACFPDLRSFGTWCAKMMLDKNHRTIACLIKKDSRRSELILDGVRKCLLDHHMILDETLIFDNPSCISDLRRKKATGVICTHYSLALAFYGEAVKLHCQIPQDFSLLSLRSDQRILDDYPRISSIAIPYRDLGFQACQSLISQCEKREPADMAVPSDPPVTLSHEKSIRTLPDFQRKHGIVIGSINTDLVLTVQEPLKTGESTLITHASSCLGGKGGNQAVQAARLEQEILLIGKIGNDPEADEICLQLQKENISSRGIIRDSSCQTGKAYIYPQKGGESLISYLPGANAALTKEDIRAMEHFFEHAGFCLLSTDITPEAVEETCRLCKKYQVKLIIKPAAPQTFKDSFYSCADIFILNQNEACILSQGLETASGQAGYFLGKGAKTVIITMGENGCYLKTDSREGLHFPAEHISPVDATGGSDAFAGTLASLLNEGYSLEDAVYTAQTAAGLCISRQGSAPSMPDKNTLLAAVQKKTR